MPTAEDELAEYEPVGIRLRNFERMTHLGKNFQFQPVTGDRPSARLLQLSLLNTGCRGQLPGQRFERSAHIHNLYEIRRYANGRWESRRDWRRTVPFLNHKEPFRYNADLLEKPGASNAANFE